MTVSNIEPFSLDHESEADDYLGALPEQPKYRNIREVEKRAKALIRDDRLRERFITKGTQAILASQS
ncbi:hypothetical protein V1283_003457 [Bradyrhizobium sp. AZCC 2262]|uniref:hypothetical protein n=1 Tax=Bradyrhizobium sp. AZCC 2262 TaxID=3117022 RepID=UPI002FF3B8B6